MKSAPLSHEGVITSTRQRADPKPGLSRMPLGMALRVGAIDDRDPESPYLWDFWIRSAQSPDRVVPGFWGTQRGLVNLPSMANCWDPRERTALSENQHASVFVTSWRGWGWGLSTEDCVVHQELSG